MVNAANAQVLVDYFEAHPERHRQTKWVAQNGDDVFHAADVEKNFCGTTMCIAGAAAYFMSDTETFKELVEGDESWTRIGGRILGLDSDESEKLFYNLDNASALDMLRAVAADDMNKFERVYRDEVA